MEDLGDGLGADSHAGRAGDLSCVVSHGLGHRGDPSAVQP